MKRVVYAVLAVMILAGGLVFARKVIWPRLRPRDPVAVAMQGLRSTDPQLRLQAVRKLGDQGERADDAIDDLNQMLVKEPNEEVRLAAAGALVKIQGKGATAAVPVLTAGLKSSDPKARADCASALGELAESAAGAAEPIATLLNDPEPRVQRAAATALVKIKGAEATAALPVLVKALQDPSDQVREESAYNVGKLGTAANDAVEPLTKLLKDENAKVQLAAAVALAQIQGDKATAALPVLTRALKDPDPVTRQDIARVFGDIGAGVKDNTEVVAGLKDLLKDQDPQARHVAAVALVKIEGDKATETLEVLQAGLRSKDPTVVAESADALGDLGPVAKDTFEKLTRLLKSPEPTVQLAAAKAVVKINWNESAEAIPILVGALGNDDAAVRKEVATLLGGLGSLAKDAVEGLGDLLRDRKPDVQRAGAVALAKIQEQDAKAALPVLKRGLDDKDAAVRAECAAALGYLGKTAAEAAEPLGKLLEDKDAAVKRAAAVSLAKIRKGDAPKGVVPVLVAGLKDEDPSVCQECAQALGELGAAGADTADALGKLAEDKNPQTKLTAAVALARIEGPKAVKTVPTLIEGLKEANADTQIQAAAALGQIGPAAKQAVEPLTKLLKDENESVRKEAEAALKKIQSK